MMDIRSIWAVGEHDVGIRCLKALQTALKSFHDVLPGQPSGVRFFATGSKENLMKSQINPHTKML
jgi:hypothetical protein